MARRRQRPNWPLRLSLLGLMLSGLLLILAWPAAEWYGNYLTGFAETAGNPAAFDSTEQLNRSRAASDFFSQVNRNLIELFTASWLFALGAATGSFANVVVYRMPRGISIAARDSACPWCKNRIQLRHNIPIFGWIMLRGRCHRCRLPISPRYPIVELCFGMMFLILYLFVLRNAASNWPWGTDPHLSDNFEAASLLLNPDWRLVVLYAHCCLLVSLLFIWGLMQLDGSRVPRKTVVFGFATGITGFLTLLYWPQAEPRFSQLLAGGDQFLFSPGLLIGLIIGVLVFLVTKQDDLRTVLEDAPGQSFEIPILGFALIGIDLGVRGAIAAFIVLGFVWFLRMVLQAFKPLETITPGIAIACATLIQICFWKYLVGPMALILGSVSLILFFSTLYLQQPRPP